MLRGCDFDPGELRLNQRSVNNLWGDTAFTQFLADISRAVACLCAVRNERLRITSIGKLITRSKLIEHLIDQGAF